MKIKKSGFTLVELLAVIVILAIIMVIATMSVNQTIMSARINSFNQSAKIIKQKSDEICSVENNINTESLLERLDLSKDDMDVEVSPYMDAEDNFKTIVKVIAKDGGKFNNIDISKLDDYNVKGFKNPSEKMIVFTVDCEINSSSSSGSSGDSSSSGSSGDSSSSDNSIKIPHNYYVKLGDNVYFDYNDGYVTVYGSGNMYETRRKTETDDTCTMNCNISEELMFRILKRFEKVYSYQKENDNIRKLLSHDGNSAMFLMNSKENMIDLLNSEVSPGVRLSDKELSDGLELANSIPELKTLEIEDGVTSIRSYVFSFMDIKKVTIPKSVTSIESGAFYYSNNINTIINKTGKAFDWNAILGSDSGDKFETGTATNVMGGKVKIIK